MSAERWLRYTDGTAVLTLPHARVGVWRSGGVWLWQGALWVAGRLYAERGECASKADAQAAAERWLRGGAP